MIFRATFAISINALALMSASARPGQTQCEIAIQDINQARYTICAFTAGSDIRLFQGKALNANDQFKELDQILSKENLVLQFAMNGGMYHKDRSAVGLYIQDGQAFTSLQKKASSGNFGLVPNGVFYIDESGFHVSETLAYAKSDLSPQFASQSGPMLVINDKLHPAFKRNSTSKRVRNGVGVSEDGETVYFVKSEIAVNFHDFASLFRNDLKTPNALYLDGVISRLYDAETRRKDIGARMGPIIAVIGSKQ